ncbi:MAG: PD40 domain-containing protein [Alphaproteobacteria bacterium]|nr:PD40 domain-containing protein [Alphaproteobacteria bacterium]
MRLLLPLLALSLPALADDDEKKDEKPKWSVDAPPGEAVQVPIDVTEGTWISLDVHPSGDRLVFDLLGDLYELPIAGGEAKPLTSGMAWDMQPLYQADGTGLIFTSDRGGGDNLWRMDGTEFTAITDEKFRLLNSPAVHGDTVLGRKHFTGSRSLGAGEIWLYHTDGGKGLQVTERKNDQKDLGEPAFSPDGRYVYWSRDASPGDHFEYNKDSNSGIYVIDRLDRQTGEVERVVGGAGGAVRPTPHPDGRHLAYVRRIRNKTVLMVKDLETDREIFVWDGLDRDMQETWAIHGVFPRFDWTPDGRSVVIWAQGGLWRVEVDLVGGQPGKATRIPFHVKDTREVRAPVRFPVDVAPETFDVRMLRGVRTSPDGGQVVFEALGHLWIRDVADGTARRLTKDEGVRELEASWSRDGKQIVYVAWDDAKLAEIRTVGAKGGKGKALTTAPGHYREPVFTPDGKQVVYRKATGGGLVSGLHGKDPGLYVLDPKSGAATRVSTHGRTPHFGPDPGILWFLDDGDQLALVGLDLVKRTEVVHARSEMATDFRVSPDGRWLAWQEQHEVHVMPWLPTGRTISVAPGGDAVPQAQASDDAGTNVHFSGDGETLWWSIGPTLHSTRVAAALEDEPPEPASFALGFTAPLRRAPGTTAIVGARIITMRGDEVVEKGTIVWERDRIVAVGPDVAVPPGAHVIDGTGKTVMPGLVDVHAHGPEGADGLVPEQNATLLANLAFGVTTMHDPSHDTETIFTASELQKHGDLVGPRLFSTGSILYGAKAPGLTAKIDSLDDALGHLRRMKAVGAVSVKSYNQPRRDQRQQVLEAGRRLRMMVVPEGGSLLQHNLTMIVDGHTTIEHSIPVQNVYDDILQLWKAQPVAYTPTLGVAYGGLMGEEYWYAKSDVWKDERLLTFVPRWQIDPRARRRELSPDEEYNHLNVARFTKRFVDAGGLVSLGAHGQREGLAAHWELWMFEQGGMTPHEALRSGTLYPAKSLGFDRDIGSLEVGKLADLLVLGSNPLEDLSRSRDIELTVLGGRVYDAATMNPVHPAGPPREPFWFEAQGTNWTPE